MSDDELLAAFVIRARRALSNSVAWDVLRARYQHHTLSPTADGLSLRFLVPPEEPMESLATRLRAMTVKTDQLYWAHTLDALYRAGNISRVRPPLIEDVERVWARACDREGPISRYGILLSNTSSGAPEFSGGADRAVGWQWVYQDIIHGDAQTSLTRSLEIEDRLHAAQAILADLLVATAVTLNLIRVCQQTGRIRLPPSTFTRPVVSSGERVHETIRAYWADPGTPLPSTANEALNPSLWTEIGKPDALLAPA